MHRILEIIEVRSVDKNRVALESLLIKLIEDIKQNNFVVAVKLYRNLWLETDYSIHISSELAESNLQGSELGTRIVSTLEAYGMVNFTVWTDQIGGNISKN